MMYLTFERSFKVSYLVKQSSVHVIPDYESTLDNKNYAILIIPLYITVVEIKKLTKKEDLSSQVYLIIFFHFFHSFASI